MNLKKKLSSLKTTNSLVVKRERGDYHFSYKHVISSLFCKKIKHEHNAMKPGEAQNKE